MKKMNAEPRVYIVPLNWNSWKYTITCLESLLKLNYKNFKVVVCDNGSTDNSIEQILSWAKGLNEDLINVCDELLPLANPPTPKPISIDAYSRLQAEAGGHPDDSQIVLIENGENLGYAGGCNVGIRYAISKSDYDYIWLLNNDTIVDPDALISLISHVRDNPEIGLCGSTLLSLSNPKSIQALGGAIYRPFTGSSKHIGHGDAWPERSLSVSEIEQYMDYVVGASMLVSRKAIEKIGLLEEGYFLYFEEIDWATRAKGKFKLGYAKSSIVYHAEGGSSGFSLIHFYYYRSMIRYSWHYRTIFTPFIVAAVIYRFTSALLRRDHKSLRLLIDSKFLLSKPKELR